MNNTHLSNLGLIALISVVIASLTEFLAEAAMGTTEAVLVCLTFAVCAIAVYAITKLVRAGETEQHDTDMQVRFMGK